jgi:hypothetical protein
MKILVTAGVFGDFRALAKDSSFVDADAILIAGNTGITERSFVPPVDTYFIAGKHEDFGMIKQLMEKDSFPWRFINGEVLLDYRIKVAGVSGTYSPNFYENASVPIKHMKKSDLFNTPKDSDILILHNVPGRLAKSGSLDFHDDLFSLLNSRSFRYVFVGGYEFSTWSSFLYLDTTVVFLPALKKGYVILDTADWSCFFQNRI